MPRVLLIEDDQAVRDGLRMALSRHGHTVDAAETGELGLERLRTAPADVVVLDLMLPGMDGFEVCRRIRASGDLPIIMLTARNDDMDVVAGLEAGADDYIVKPVRARVLEARIRAVLRRTSAEPRHNGAQQPGLEHYGSLVIDRAGLVISKNGTPIARARAHRTSAAARAFRRGWPGVEPAAPAGSRVGTRISRRLPAGRRVRPTAALENRGRLGPAGLRPNRTRLRLSLRAAVKLRWWLDARTLGLRTRLLISFALLGVLTATLVAGAVYYKASNVILQKAQDTAVTSLTDRLAKLFPLRDLPPSQDRLDQIAGTPCRTDSTPRWSFTEAKSPPAAWTRTCSRPNCGRR